MSGGEADVKNSIWMRAVLYGGVFLAVGILAFATRAWVSPTSSMLTGMKRN